MQTTKPLRRSRTLAIIAILTVVGIWGLAGPVIVHTLKFVPPFTFLFLRFAIATPFFLPLILRDKAIKSLKTSDLTKLLPLSFLGITLAIGLIFVGYQHTTALDGSLISILGPLMIVAGGGIFLKEEITGREKLGLLIVLLGSVVTLFQPLLEQGIAGADAAFGNLLIFASTAAWAAYALIDKSWQKKFNPLTITATGSVLSLLTFAPLALYEISTVNYQLSTTNYQLRDALPGIIYMAILSYIVAYYLYEWSIRRIEVSEAAVFGYLQPLFAFPAAYLLLGEIPTRYFLLGAILIGVGVFLTEYK